MRMNPKKTKNTNANLHVSDLDTHEQNQTVTSHTLPQSWDLKYIFLNELIHAVNMVSGQQVQARLLN